MILLTLYLTVFRDDAEMVPAHEAVVELDDVRMVQLGGIVHIPALTLPQI